MSATSTVAPQPCGPRRYLHFDGTFNVIAPTFGLELGLAGALLIVDVLGRRAVAGMFDWEQLVTGSRG